MSGKTFSWQMEMKTIKTSPPPPKNTLLGLERHQGVESKRGEAKKHQF